MVPTVEDLVNDPLNAPLVTVDEFDELKEVLQASLPLDGGACWIYINRIQNEPIVARLCRLITWQIPPSEAMTQSRYTDQAKRAWYNVLSRIVKSNEIEWPSQCWPDPLPAITRWPLPRRDCDGGRPLRELFGALGTAARSRSDCLHVDLLPGYGADGRPELVLHFYPITPWWCCANLRSLGYSGHVGVVGVDVLDPFTEMIQLNGLLESREVEPMRTALWHDRIYRTALDYVRLAQLPDDDRFVAAQLFVDWFCFRGNEIGYYPDPGHGVRIRPRQ